MHFTFQVIKHSNNIKFAHSEIIFILWMCKTNVGFMDVKNVCKSKQLITDKYAILSGTLQQWELFKGWKTYFSFVRMY